MQEASKRPPASLLISLLSLFPKAEGHHTERPIIYDQTEIRTLCWIMGTKSDSMSASYTEMNTYTHTYMNNPMVNIFTLGKCY